MTIKTHTTTRHQADCDRCGWHTREADGDRGKQWVEYMVAEHEKSCPNPPPPRCGALMKCGCWYYALPGDEAGRTKAECPLHGLVVAIKMNVDAPPHDPRTGLWVAQQEGTK